MDAEPMTERDEMLALADELDGWHDCADGDVPAGNGHFRLQCTSDSEQQRLNLRATLREAAKALRSAARTEAGYGVGFEAIPKRPFAFAVKRAPENGADEWRLFMDEGEARTEAEQLDGDYEALFRVGDRRSAIAPMSRRDVLRKLEATAGKQKAYFNAKQSEFPCIEDFTDGDGNLTLPDDIAPLLEQARANGHYSEADWWLSTIRYAIAALPAPGGITTGWQPIETAPKDGTPIIGAFWSIRWADSHRKGDVVTCWWQPEFEAFISSCREMTLAQGLTFENGSSRELHSPVIEPVTHWKLLDRPTITRKSQSEESES